MREAGYLPIEAYGAIGNLRSVALVGRDGSIDWCCLPEMDSPSVFGRVLDYGRGGHFSVRPSAATPGTQRYLGDTNVLETAFETSGGRLTVADFMPLAGELAGCGRSETANEVHRLLRCEGTAVEVEVEWAPRPDYARANVTIEPGDGSLVARSPAGLLSLAGLPAGFKIGGDGNGPLVRWRGRLEGGQRLALVCRWESERPAVVEESEDRLAETLRAWEDWAHREEATGDRAWAGPWKEAVLRSELALKLLTHADTGAIAAAPTTSLPETIGGVRNWDYRYTWIRDAAMTAQAFLVMGHVEEMVAFVRFIERAASRSLDEDRQLQIMFGLHGQSDLREHRLEQLEGYRRSRPVRIGNDAFVQHQPDVLGELLDAAYQLARRGIPIERDIWEFLPRVADITCAVWRKPDHGLWEMPLEPRHYVYSKLMMWVGLNRAVRLADRHGLPGNRTRWSRAARLLRDEILEHGYDVDSGAFVQAYGSRELDAANLLLAIEGLIPFDDPRYQATIDRTLSELTEDGLVYRYRVDDGLPGEEGGWVLCTSWMVDALALSGRIDDAERLFAGLMGRANHLGLFSEQIAPRSGEFLGNFPQAFSHIGVINSALFLSDTQGRATPLGGTTTPADAATAPTMTAAPGPFRARSARLRQ